MEWIADPTAWLGLGTLILLEIVLGIDNLIFIAILVDRLPPAQRRIARIIGLSLALGMRIAMLAGISWLQTLTTPLFTVSSTGISLRDLILMGGGLFLLFKATTELHGRLEGGEAGRPGAAAGHIRFWQAIVQIVILDFVFSLDSIITAVGMVDHLPVMIIAVAVAIVAMMVVSGPLTNFVNAHPTVVILALGFLLMIGFSLFVEGWGLKIPKGYLYAAIAFSILIEMLNQIASRNRAKKARVGNLRSRTADAVLRLLGGARPDARVDEALPAGLAPEAAAEVFKPAERTIVGRVLGMAERTVGTIMTPTPDVSWLDVGNDARTLSRRILRTGHAAYPVCRGALENLLGVARAPELICDLLEKGRIDTSTLDTKPITFPEDGSVLHLVEQLQGVRIPMAIINDRSGSIKGVVTSTDLLQAILGDAGEQR
jgi:predicted tellurium resistance membrane protein TerC/CBS domain-containing protein